MKPHLFEQNRSLAPPELRAAGRICEESLQSVLGRDDYIGQNGIEPGFALPDSNWSYESSNDFVRLFKRIVRAAPEDLNALRAFTLVFSGYSLFHLSGAHGITTRNLLIDARLCEAIRGKLDSENAAFVSEWLNMTKEIPRRYIFSPPAMLGEIGHDVDGVIVNSDTSTYQERVNLIWQSGLADWIDSRIAKTGEIKICEIGGGYGALCSWFKQAFPNASYTIIDLPESLLFSRLYISLTRPDLATGLGTAAVRFGVRFLPNYQADSLLGEEFDLVINTLSMSEMTELQVNHYAQLMTSAWLRDGGMFFEQNHDNTHLGLLHAQTLLERSFPHRLRLHGDDSRFRNGHPNIWSMHPIDLTPAAKRPGAPGDWMIEDLGAFNILRAGRIFWGISKTLGAIAPQFSGGLDYPPIIFSGTTREEIIRKISSSEVLLPKP